MNKKLAMNILAAASFALASTAFAGGVVNGSQNANHVPGESLDSGLGQLPANYDGAEYDVSRHVIGEKLDSGLGELAADYDASEYDRHPVLGEKLDSGLGQLSSADVMRFVR